MSGYCFSRGVEQWIWIFGDQERYDNDDDEEEDKIRATNEKVLCKYVNLHRFVLAKEKKGRGISYSVDKGPVPSQTDRTRHFQ